jgi:hypothetical protein
MSHPFLYHRRTSHLIVTAVFQAMVYLPARDRPQCFVTCHLPNRSEHGGGTVVGFHQANKTDTLTIRFAHEDL